MVRHKGEALNLLIRRELLLQCRYTFHKEIVDAAVGAQVLTGLKLDVVLTRKFLNEAELGHDESRHKLTVVGNDCHLVYIFVHEQQRLYLLRSNILAVGGLEQVFYALGEEQFAVLQVAGVACAEIAILGKRLCVGLGTVIIALRDGRTLKQHLALFRDLKVDAAHRIAHRTNGVSLALVVTAHGGQALCQAVANNHIYAHRVDKLFNLGRHA